MQIDGGYYGANNAMTDLKQLFYGRKANKKALAEYGFKNSGNAFKYSEKILKGQFLLTISVENDVVKTEVYDIEADCPYYLFSVEGAEGAFVGEVRSEYERVINDVSEKCFSRAEVYREKTTLNVIKYAKSKYGTPLEFLWHDENSVMRRKDNRKWYCAFLPVQRSKIGLEGEGRIEIIDLRAPKQKIPALLDGINYLPAYHMNKKSWLTIPLDGRVSAEIICAFIDVSYNLAGEKRK